MAVLLSRRIFTIPQPVHIYGVEWDWTSSGPTAGTRTDDAVGFDAPQPAVNNGAESFAKINTSQIQYYMIQGN